eukprot:evm.model.NODE_7253_length_3527_cov_16.514885.1
MAFMEDDDLLTEPNSLTSSSLSPPFLLLLLLSQGLNYLHKRQYLHQDVKPGNILLTLTHFAKLADFGLTVGVNSAEDALGESDSAPVAVGSARYWPPELWGPTSK